MRRESAAAGRGVPAQPGRPTFAAALPSGPSVPFSVSARLPVPPERAPKRQPSSHPFGANGAGVAVADASHRRPAAGEPKSQSEERTQSTLHFRSAGEAGATKSGVPSIATRIFGGTNDSTRKGRSPRTRPSFSGMRSSARHVPEGCESGISKKPPGGETRPRASVTRFQRFTTTPSPRWISSATGRGSGAAPVPSRTRASRWTLSPWR